MTNKIYLFMPLIIILTGCRFKEEKLPADVDFTNTILLTADTNSNPISDPQIFAVKVDSPHTLYQLTDTRYPLEEPVWLPDGSGIVFLWTRFDYYSNNFLSKFIGQGHVGWADPADVYIMDTTGTRRIIICWDNLSKNEKEKYKELYGLIFDIAPTSSGKIISDLGGYKFVIHDNIQPQTSFNVIKINPELSNFYGDFALSPDGKEVAFVTKLKDDPSIEIFVMSLENGDYKRLTNNNLTEGEVCWSNEDGKIYFSRIIKQRIKENSMETQSDIFVMDSDGKNQKNLTNSPDISECVPKISPDDKLIAYIVEEDTEYAKYYTEIWVMNNEGKNKRKIIRIHSYLCGEISWYPKR